MWQTITAASIVVALMRTLPAFFSNLVMSIKNSPKISKFLDYTICLVTGEVIYSIAFNGIPSNEKYHWHYLLTIMTMLLAAILMWHTTKLSKSLLISIISFIIGYNLIIIFN